MRGEGLDRNLATSLERNHPGPAASLRARGSARAVHTVARRGVTGTLAKTLTTSDPIESMFSIARRRFRR